MLGTTYFDTKNKIWSGAETEFAVDKNKNVAATFLNALNEDRDKVMQIDGDTGVSMTKSQVRLQTIRCAQNLAKLGCTEKHIIGCVARNHHSLTPLLLGSFAIGAAFNAVDVQMVKDGVSPIFQRVRPSFIFCDSDVIEAVNKICLDIGLSAKLFSVDAKVNGFDSIDRILEETGEEDKFVCTEIVDTYSHIAIIACSSGSTGMPKTFSVSQGNVQFFSKSIALPFETLSLTFSSLFWFSGIWAVLSSIYSQQRLFSRNVFSEKLFFELAQKYKVQMFSGNPSQFHRIIRSDERTTADLSSLAVGFLMGAGTPKSLLESFKTSLPNVMPVAGYGMTESCGGISYSSGNELFEHPTSSGKLAPGVRVKIVKDEVTGEKCGIGEEGEIWIRSTTPSMGYYRDEENNKKSYTEDNYFKTGDLGFIDESGRLYVNGRKKEMFKNRNFPISPAEIENIILKHPAVKMVCVVNVFDVEISTDLPAAVVVSSEPNSSTKDEICALVADNLASYKHLEGRVYFVDELEMTASGKVIRTKAQKIAQNSFSAKTN